ncbi:EthD family reductase [Duganella callida]|uniref:EthD family reductase n=1 Tax=Duganella callida TaxID=2561932 RepID=A0A4Y9SB40_9BURK|nr:EthD family reductase [Duganella callida]TFW16812.1 EthD family reductase [Duganella callida]
MSENNKQVTIYVYYQGTPETRFDRDYYTHQHLPLTLQAWGKYGLISCRAFYPSIDQNGTIAICESVYRDEAAVEAAFNSPERTEVMADVARYTDATPLRMRGLPL